MLYDWMCSTTGFACMLKPTKAMATTLLPIIANVGSLRVATRLSASESFVKGPLASGAGLR